MLLAICAWSLLVYPPGCARLNSNSALVLQAPLAVNINLQLLVAHISKLVYALVDNDV